jgi:hypothetical protein
VLVAKFVDAWPTAFWKSLFQICLPVECLQLPQLSISRYDPIVGPPPYVVNAAAASGDQSGAHHTTTAQTASSAVRLPRLNGRPTGLNGGLPPMTTASMGGRVNKQQQQQNQNRLRTSGITAAPPKTTVAVNDNDVVDGRTGNGDGGKNGNDNGAGEDEVDAQVPPKLPVSPSGE